MTHWSHKLQAIGACEDAVAWAKTQPSFAVAWKTCKRGDWMLWLIVKLNHKRERIVSVACDCAELALPFTKDKRVKACIEITRAWTRGEATIEQVREARYASISAAYAAAHASAHAAYAAYAAADAYAAHAADRAPGVAAATYATAAATSAATNAAAATSAALAAYAAPDAATYAAMKTLSTCADLVRREFPSICLSKVK